MPEDQSIDNFLSSFGKPIVANTLLLRQVLLAELPNIQEEVDVSAKMIAYSYGQKYAELVCTIIPSKKGIKLGFYKGIDLPDPNRLLKGNGKIARYVEINKADDIQSDALTELINESLNAYQRRLKQPVS